MAMMVMEIVESGNRYIFVEETPSQYGGLSKGDFEASDSVNEIIVKPSAQHIVEFSTNQHGRKVGCWMDALHWQKYWSVVFFSAILGMLLFAAWRSCDLWISLELLVILNHKTNRLL
ncbi:uncharacterized protein LOC125217982 isoform X1 [Salvia hispanica]|uniref:uncharacterized protein LOC125217982 isoform X1 n=1 Tax=Salvia hispanica TaxID=49212 RepID=UPI002009A0A2|nr:uncharacterized protein LOC125217982 isoform X1 [Salvia hispanica]